ncbi:hypothetical protein TUN199_11765, partial [Pyrenophora tritici-repentis]
LIRLGQNVQAERAERAGSLVDKYVVEGVADRVVNNQANLQSSQMWPLLTSGLEYTGTAIPK